MSQYSTAYISERIFIIANYNVHVNKHKANYFKFYINWLPLQLAPLPSWSACHHPWPSWLARLLPGWISAESFPRYPGQSKEMEIVILLYWNKRNEFFFSVNNCTIKRNRSKNCNLHFAVKLFLWEKGHLLEIHLLEKSARHQNLDCSTPFKKNQKSMPYV